MESVEPARADDIDELVRLQARLFAEDAAAHDPFADPSWPLREGADDYRRMIADDASVVLVARCPDGSLAGMVDGYVARSSPTRRPASYGVLRGLYVVADRRRDRLGRRLVEAFVAWAREQGCDEVHVDHYAANSPAGELYASLGFDPRSVSRVKPL